MNHHGLTKVRFFNNVSFSKATHECHQHLWQEFSLANDFLQRTLMHQNVFIEDTKG